MDTIVTIEDLKDKSYVISHVKLVGMINDLCSTLKVGDSITEQLAKFKLQEVVVNDVNLDALKDEEVRQYAIKAAQAVLPYVIELERRKYEVSLYVGHKYDGAKTDTVIYCTAKKELK